MSDKEIEEMVLNQTNANEQIFQNLMASLEEDLAKDESKTNMVFVLADNLANNRDFKYSASAKTQGLANALLSGVETASRLREMPDSATADPAEQGRPPAAPVVAQRHMQPRPDSAAPPAPDDDFDF